MCFFGLLGMAGLYARQVEETGWLGLAGYLLLSLWLVLIMGFTFVEAFILPLLATAAPQFVEGFLGMFNGSAGTMNLGALPALWTLAGTLYMLGGLLFGIATFRAGILPRWAAGLLAARDRVGPRGCAASARAPAESGGAGGVSSGLAGLCALVGTTSAHLFPGNDCPVSSDERSGAVVGRSLRPSRLALVMAGSQEVRCWWLPSRV